jgi:hypothetical protein
VTALDKDRIEDVQEQLLYAAKKAASLAGNIASNATASNVGEAAALLSAEVTSLDTAEAIRLLAMKVGATLQVRDANVTRVE